MSSALGKSYENGEVIIRQGEIGDCMYVILDGQVEIVTVADGNEVRLAVREKDDFVGEMAIFDREVRSAEVRALGKVRVLKVDKRNFMNRVHEDPSLALRLVRTMSRRIRELSAEVARLKSNEL